MLKSQFTGNIFYKTLNFEYKFIPGLLFLHKFSFVKKTGAN